MADAIRGNKYILYVCISVGFFSSRLTSEFKSAPTKMRHAQSRFQAYFFFPILARLNDSQQWAWVAYCGLDSTTPFSLHATQDKKTKSAPATPPRNPSTCLLPSCKCTQALVTSTICVPRWIIQELAAVCSVGKHAKRNQSARSLQERRRLSRNAVFIMSRRREGVCGGGEVEQRRRKKN